MDELLEAVKEFRQAFVIAVGDRSPFAKVALSRIDAAIESVTQPGVQLEGDNCTHNQPALVNPETGTCILCGLRPSAVEG